jgi:hypothetical protein
LLAPAWVWGELPFISVSIQGSSLRSKWCPEPARGGARGFHPRPPLMIGPPPSEHLVPSMPPPAPGENPTWCGQVCAVVPFFPCLLSPAETVGPTQVAQASPLVPRCCRRGGHGVGGRPGSCVVRRAGGDAGLVGPWPLASSLASLLGLPFGLFSPPCWPLCGCCSRRMVVMARAFAGECTRRRVGRQDELPA